MENSKLDLIGKVTSAPKPLRGQKHRSSGNFEIKPPRPCVGIRWILPDNISIRLKKDIRMSGDETKCEAIWNGMVTEYFGDTTRYYIANPSGAKGNFTVRAYAIYSYSGEELIGKMISSPRKRDGQKHRSSDNFSMLPPKEFYNGIRWEVAGNISFNVKEDLGVITDPIHYKNIVAGKVTSIEEKENFYIADPKNASSNFVVQAFGVRR